MEISTTHQAPVVTMTNFYCEFYVLDSITVCLRPYLAESKYMKSASSMPNVTYLKTTSIVKGDLYSYLVSGSTYSFTQLTGNVPNMDDTYAHVIEVEERYPVENCWYLNNVNPLPAGYAINPRAGVAGFCGVFLSISYLLSNNQTYNADLPLILNEFQLLY